MGTAGLNYYIPIEISNTGTGEITFNFDSIYNTFSCFLPTTWILMADNVYKQISTIKSGDNVRGLSGNTRKVKSY